MPLNSEQLDIINKEKAKKQGIVAAEDVSRENARRLLNMSNMETKIKDHGSAVGRFFKGLGREIAKPFAEVGTSAVNLGESVYDLARGDVQGAGEALQKSRNVPLMGRTEPAFTGSESIGESAKNMIGYGAEIASNVVGGGAAKSVVGQGLKGLVKQGFKTGLKGGVAAGALGLGGRSAEEDDSVGTILLKTVGGGLLGGAMGGVIGGAVPVVSKAFKSIMQPVEQKVSGIIREGIDKGIKPYFGGKTTSAMRDNYYKKAEQAFISIFKRKPEILDDALGEKVARLPQNRKEMFEALGEAKKAVYAEYHKLAQEAGEGGVKFDVTKVADNLAEVSQSKKFSPEIRNYAERLFDEVSELHGQAPDVIEARIQELNNSLAGFYEGRISKAKAQVDASVANLMREELDNGITGATGESYKALKNEYGALKSVEKDLARQVNVELRKNAKGLIDMTDIFTGGDIAVGLLTANPTQVAKGLFGVAIKERLKFLNNPNRYIKNAFEVLENPPADIRAGILKAADFIKKRSGLQIEDVSGKPMREVFIDGKSVGKMEVGQAEEWAAYAESVGKKFRADVIDEGVKKTNPAVDQTAPKITPYKGEKDITTKFLESIKGKTTVSKQEILNFAKRPELKKGEADLLNKYTKDLPEGKVSAKEFADNIKRDLLVLKPVKVKNPEYKKLSLKGGKNYEEVVFESDITTNGSPTHYQNSEKYVAHARGDEVVESGKKVWREQEIQSDLLQKNNLEQAKKKFHNTDITGIDNTLPLKEQMNIQKQRRIDEISKLEPFTNDRFGERIMKERIKAKTQAGYDKYRLPTGKTIGEIEGFGGGAQDWNLLTASENLGQPVSSDLSKIKPGSVLVAGGDLGDRWVFIKDLGNGSAKLGPMIDDSAMYEDYIELLKKGEDKFVKDRKKLLKDYGYDDELIEDEVEQMLESATTAEEYIETINISGDTKAHPQAKRYENWGKFLKNKYGGKEVVDPQGNSWIEIDLKPEYKKTPIEAFGVIGAVGVGALGIQANRSQ